MTRHGFPFWDIFLRDLQNPINAIRYATYEFRLGQQKTGTSGFILRPIGIHGFCRVYVRVIEGCIIGNIKSFPKGSGS